MRSLALTLALVGVAPAAMAAAPPSWIVDRAASSIRFSSSVGGAAFSGGFARWDADIRFDLGNLAASSAAVSIDVASVSTGDPDRDQALPSPTFFSAAKFPRATFVARAFRYMGGDHYQASGQLTVRGVTRPLILPFTLAVTGDKARMRASLTLNRLAFGIGQDEWRATTVLPAQVKVDIALTARRG